MANRRRSDRIAVALPVWLKDAQGGERTLTANVSTHGIAVFSPKPRALRQYMELELSLPEPRATISVTAMVSRLADLVRPDGQRIPGLGLDFFLFDAQAKTHWQHYLRNLRAGTSDTPPPTPLELPPIHPVEDEEAPTFIIKPRDLGRLWAFYRGELSKGLVRIETPIPKPTGTPVELLVVHPSSQAEWILTGKVARATPQTRQGRPVLEIGLVGLGPELKSAFRNFVATGRGMIEDDISVSAERPSGLHLVPAPPTVTHDEQVLSSIPDRPDLDGRIPSVVIDLDAFEDVFSTPSTMSVPDLDLAPPEPSELPLSVEIDLNSEPSLPAEPSLAAGVAEDDEAHSPPHVEEEPTLMADEGPSTPGFEPEALPGPPAPSLSNGGNNVFASFFVEAAAEGPVPPQPIDLDALDDEPISIPDLDVAAIPTVLSEAFGAPRSLPPPIPLELDSATEPDSEEFDAPLVAPALLPPATLTRDLEPPPAPSGLHLVDRSGEPIPLHRRKPTSAPNADVLPLNRPPLPETARPRHEMRVLRGAPADGPRVTPVLPRAAVVSPAPAPAPPPGPAPGQKVTRSRGENLPQNPPVPGNVFDFEAGDDPAEVSADELPVKGMPIPAPAASRRAQPPPQRHTMIENQVGHHTNLSTESGNPDLARDVALARARVVRSPHSVTACYRLSMLLVRQGERSSIEEALDALQKVLALEPNHPGAHHKMAEVLARSGRLESAAEHLSRARRLGYRIDPDLELLVSRGAVPTAPSD